MSTSALLCCFSTRPSLFDQPPHLFCHSSDIFMLQFSLVAVQSLSTSSFLYCFGSQDTAFDGGEKPGKGAIYLKRETEKKVLFFSRTFKFSSLSNFQIHSTVLLSRVSMLYVTPPGLTYLLTGSSYLLTTSPISIPVEKSVNYFLPFIFLPLSKFSAPFFLPTLCLSFLPTPYIL